MSNMLPGQFGFLVFGASDQMWGNQKLPLNLGFMGMANCQMLAGWDLAFPFWTGAGRVVWKTSVPNSTSLMRWAFYNQVWVMDPAANSARIAVSNGGRGQIGNY